MGMVRGKLVHRFLRIPQSAPMGRAVEFYGQALGLTGRLISTLTTPKWGPRYDIGREVRVVEDFGDAKPWRTYCGLIGLSSPNDQRFTTGPGWVRVTNALNVQTLLGPALGDGEAQPPTMDFGAFIENSVP